MISRDQIQAMLNEGVVLGEAGEKVGKVGQVYLDDESGNPEWVTANTGLFGTSETFIPLQEATVTGSEVRVPYTKAFIKDAPNMEVDDHLTRAQEGELYKYYGLYDDSRSQFSDVDSMQPHGAAGAGYSGEHEVQASAGHDTSGPNADEAMTRSEEQLNVGTERVATGKARLRKYIVTENVTTTVPVQREEVRLEREPIAEANRDEAMTGGDLAEEEHEVTLTEERVVVSKDTIPVERVSLGKETVTEQEEVNEEVRKEQIEADLPGAGGGAERTGRQHRE